MCSTFISSQPSLQEVLLCSLGGRIPFLRCWPYSMRCGCGSSCAYWALTDWKFAYSLIASSFCSLTLFNQSCWNYPWFSLFNWNNACWTLLWFFFFHFTFNFLLLPLSLTCIFLPSFFCVCSIPSADHERKIELIRYLMSGYVNVHVLNTLSEHANVLASSAVAAFQDGADQLPPFLFLPVPSCQSERAPKRDG